MHASKLIKYLISMIIFCYHLVGWCKLQIQLWTFRSQCGCIKKSLKLEGLHRKSKKNNHLEFSILNSHVVTIMYLRFRTYFHVVKQKFNIFVFFSTIYLFPYHLSLLYPYVFYTFGNI